jgi:hypothetical protein
MAETDKVEFLPPRRFRLYLYFLENQAPNMAIRMAGTIKMFLVTQEKAKKVICNLSKAIWH